MTDRPLPTGWISDQLANFIKPRGEKVSPSDFPEFKFIGMDNIESQTTKILGSVPAQTMKSNASRFYEGDVLYGRLRPYLNKVAQVNFNGLASAEFIVFPDTPILKSSYLKYRLNAADFVSFASHLNEGDRPRVSFEQIGTFNLLLPPLPEQHRIVDKIEELFSDLDDGIASLKKAQQQLKVYRQAVLKWAFEGKLTAQWREEQKRQGKLDSAETLLEQIKAEREQRYQQKLAQWQADVKDWEASGKVGKKPGKPSKTYDDITLPEADTSSFPKIPESWTWTSLGNLSIFGPRNGYSPKPVGYTTNTKSLTLSATTAGKFQKQHFKYLNEIIETNSYLWLEDGDLLIQRANTIEYVGVAAIYRGKNHEFVYPDLMMRIKFSSKLNVEYLCYLINNQRSRNYFKDRATGTAGNMPKINKTTVSSLPIQLPSLSEQNQIVEEIESRLSICDSLEAAISENLQRAEALRQSILKQAFEGKLVPQDPNDEPASVLLERIRQTRNKQGQLNLNGL